MSVTVTKADGVTVVTMSTRSGGSWPPCCELLGALCYSPPCFSVSQTVRRLQASSHAVLGTMQIMVGLLNIGLGAIVLSQGGWRPLLSLGAPYWLGAVFIAVGIMCVLAGRFPSPCLVGISMMVNTCGAALAITAIVLYTIDLTNYFSFYWMCQDGYYGYDYNDGYGYDRQSYRHATAPSIQDIKQRYLKKCEDMKQIAVMLLKALDIVLLILAVLQLFLTVSSAAMSLKALCCRNKQEGKEAVPDVERYQPLLEEVSTTKPAAVFQEVPDVHGERYEPQPDEVITTNPAA